MQRRGRKNAVPASPPPHPSLLIHSTVQVIGGHWRVSAGIGDYQQASAVLGEHRWLLAGIGGYRRASAVINGHRRLWAGIDGYWGFGGYQWASAVIGVGVIGGIGGCLISWWLYLLFSGAVCLSTRLAMRTPPMMWEQRSRHKPGEPRNTLEVCIRWQSGPNCDRVNIC